MDFDYLSPSTLFQLTRKVFFRYIHIYAGALLSLFLLHYTEMRLPFMMSQLSTLIKKGHYNKISLLSFAIVAITIFIGRSFSRWIFFYPARPVEKALSLEVLSLLESVPPRRYHHQNIGQFYQTLYKDLRKIKQFLALALFQSFNLCVALCVIIPCIISFNPLLLWAVLPLFVSVFLFIVLLRSYHHQFKVISDKQGAIHNHLIETYVGKSTIKNYHAEPSFQEMFQTLTSEELSAFKKAGMGTSVGLPLVSLGLGLSLLWGAYLIHTNRLGVGALVFFVAVLYLLRGPLSFFSWMGIIYSEAKTAHHRLQELVETLSLPSQWEDNLQAALFSSTSDFYYIEIPFWEQEHSLSLPLAKERWTVLLSPTGHGKSTVLQSLAFLFKHQEISVSLVEQNPYLFNATVSDNFFLGRTPTEEEKEEALALLHLFELSYLSLDSHLGEYASLCSGGEGKRLALIRSLLSHSEVFLWDDPFSSVALSQEESIFLALRERYKNQNKTFILTTHRLSTVKRCDELVLLDKSEGIIERGEVSQLTTLSRTCEFFEAKLV